MSIRITCPGCQVVYTVPEEDAGKEARCVRCGQIIPIPRASADPSPPLSAVPVPEERLDVEPVDPPPGGAVGAEANSRMEAPPDAEVVEGGILRPARTIPQEPGPNTAKRRMAAMRRQRPAPRPSGSGAAFWFLARFVLLVTVGVGVSLTVVGLVIPDFWQWALRTMREKLPISRAERQIARTTPVVPPPAPVAAPRQPSEPAAEDPAKRLAALKDATVFVKVGEGLEVGTGSGFVIQTEGPGTYIVTNQHVVAPREQRVVVKQRVNPPLLAQPRPGAPPPLMRLERRRVVTLAPAVPPITVVFHSGTSDEQAIRGNVVASDTEHDLAVILVGRIRNPPHPLEVSPTSSLRETMPVSICGFPFGQALALGQPNPSVTVGKAWVSNLHRDPQGRLLGIQLDGNVNPGNSGGPVVDDAGRLIAVAVATIRGSGIGLAIPGEQVRDLLQGRAAKPRLVARRLPDGAVQLDASVELLDPLHRLKSIALDYVVVREATAKASRLGGDDSAPLPNARRLDLKPAGNIAQGSFRLPEEVLRDANLLVQIHYVDGRGKERLTQTQTLTLDVVGLRAEPVVLAAVPGARPGLPPETEVAELPAAIQDVAVGGGGRYLLLHSRHTFQLFIFDTAKGRLVRSLPLPPEETKIVAGRYKFVIAFPEHNLVQRWSLVTFERELTTTVPVHMNLRVLGLGSASDGPLLVGNGLLDLRTFRALRVEMQQNAGIPDDETTQVRASADGSVFGMFCPRPRYNFSRVCVVAGSQVKLLDMPSPSTYVAPGANGKFVYTYQGAFVLESTRAVATKGKPEQGCLPSENGIFYLSGLFRTDPRAPGPDLRLAETEGSLVTLPPEIFQKLNTAPGEAEALASDLRIHLLPVAKRIIVIPPPFDRLLLYPLDFDAALAKSNLDYFFIDSTPPRQAAKGSTYSYQMSVKSKAGGLKFALDSAPPEMKISQTGELTWSVPASPDEMEPVVIVKVVEAGGRDLFQTFSIRLRDN